jgi:hypothetical protein
VKALIVAHRSRLHLVRATISRIRLRQSQLNKVPVEPRDQKIADGLAAMLEDVGRGIGGGHAYYICGNPTNRPSRLSGLTHQERFFHHRFRPA